MGGFIDHTGETNIATNGMKMTIIAYRRSDDMDIQFEDGTVVYHKRYRNFKKGTIAYTKQHIGETNIATNGMKITIIAYRNSKDIDIKFEDGNITYNKSYDSFKRGFIRYCECRLGETNIATNGMKMTIIAYRNSTDIDIQFEDKTIVYNKTYKKFKMGIIKHPNMNTQARKKMMECIGETNIATNGMKMTIIAYRNGNDIDIQFEDKTIAYNKLYGAFKKGNIKHPNMNTRIQNQSVKRIGETHIMNCGLKAKIIKYDNATNITIQFENNIVIYNRHYDDFKQGHIKMPNIINNIKLKEFAYKLNNDWYYICSHPTWTEDKILSVKEIYAYQLKQTA